MTCHGKRGFFFGLLFSKCTRPGNPERDPRSSKLELGAGTKDTKCHEGVFTAELPLQINAEMVSTAPTAVRAFSVK